MKEIFEICHNQELYGFIGADKGVNKLSYFLPCLLFCTHLHQEQAIRVMSQFLAQADAKKGKSKGEASKKQKDIPVAEEDKPAKKAKARRGPTGYAIVGEDVADSPADRRARLKAAKNSGYILCLIICL